MLFDHRGNRIEESQKVKSPDINGRRGMGFDAYSLPKCAIIDPRRSKGFQNRLRNDAKLRERIEKADKMTGTKTLHLEMLNRNNNRGDLTPEVERALIINQEFGQRVKKMRLAKQDYTEGE